ncbi:MAG: hypothetical protein AB7T59_16975 [Hyphomonadaceae bacterium]
MTDQTERREDLEDVAELGAASELTQAIGNTGVEPNSEPLYFK